MPEPVYKCAPDTQAALDAVHTAIGKESNPDATKEELTASWNNPTVIIDATLADLKRSIGAPQCQMRPNDPQDWSSGMMVFETSKQHHADSDGAEVTFRRLEGGKWCFTESIPWG
jgi:hypothetical protein